MTGIVKYRRQCLLSIGAAMQKQHNRGPPQTFQRLNDLAIFVTSKVKRGTKGFGRQRIPGRLSRGYSCEPTKRETTVLPQAGGLGDWWSSTWQHGCNVNNLITVSCQQETHSTCHDKPSNANDNYINIGLLNPWSVCNKANSIHDFIVDHKLDALALTETWLKGDERDNVTIQELLPPCYKFCQQARANRGGGVAIIYHNRLNIQNTPALHKYTSFEAIECDIVSSQPVKLIVLY